MTNKFIYILFIFVGLCSHAQTLNGKVIDAKTKSPLETVSVYFDNTTIGTTTNEMGEFSIDYNDAVQSTLVISFLGYEKIFISDYRKKQDLVIELKESVNELETVVINADDGMSREQKMRYFKKEFLGQSENGKSCKILNEDAIRLRYTKSDRSISASSKKPIKVLNKNLKYEISFDLIDFEMRIGNWGASSVAYAGTSFFKDLNQKNKNRIIKARAKTYKGSVQHFMRALYNKNFENEGYIFGKKGYRVNPYDFFTISEANENGIKTVSLKEKLDIFYKTVSESVIQTNIDSFTVDTYGNYAPVTQILFGGDLGKQRVGDMLPLDYNIKK